VAYGIRQKLIAIDMSASGTPRNGSGHCPRGSTQNLDLKTNFRGGNRLPVPIPQRAQCYKLSNRASVNCILPLRLLRARRKGISQAERV